MTNMKNNIIGGMIKYGIIEEEDAEVYSYGLKLLIMYGYIFVFVIIVSSQMGCLLEGMFFLISYKLLRSCTGGYHAKNAIRCFFASSIVFVGAMFYIRNYSLNIYIIVLCAVLSITVVFCCAPLIDRNKPLSENECSYNRKRARIIVIVETVVMMMGYRWDTSLGVAVLTGMLCCVVLLLIGCFKEQLLSRKLPNKV